MYPILNRRTFSDHLHTSFTVVVEGGQAVSLMLAEVKRLDQCHSVESGIESYALIFEGPTSPMLARGSFEFVHAHLGELVIFIVPLGPKRGVMRYEAVFN